jgi:UDP-glucose 4-epimerase
MSGPTQRIAVTGGRGRLASLIADYFFPPSHPLTLFSRNAGPGFRALADLADPETLAETDVILHLAWSSLPATSEQMPGVEQVHDLPYLERLLSALTAAPEARDRHFVFFSSGGTVYGNAPGRPNVESDPCAPIGRYGRAKREAEAIVERFARERGLPCTILRIANPYGYPVPKNRAQGLIPHALRCASEGQPLTLWGDGSARKDFLYYTDFLAGLAAVLQHRLTGTFNLCAGESHDLHEVLALVEAQTGARIDRRLAPAPAWDVHDSRLDRSRLSAATGWQPVVPLAEGIRRAAAGYASAAAGSEERSPSVQP